MNSVSSRFASMCEESYVWNRHPQKPDVPRQKGSVNQNQAAVQQPTMKQGKQTKGYQTSQESTKTSHLHEIDYFLY